MRVRYLRDLTESERDVAKANGAWFDPEAKRWFIPTRMNDEAFKDILLPEDWQRPRASVEDLVFGYKHAEQYAQIKLHRKGNYGLNDRDTQAAREDYAQSYAKLVQYKPDMKDWPPHNEVFPAWYEEYKKENER